MTRIGGVRCVIAVVGMLCVCGGAGAQKGALSGVVIEQMDTGGGGRSLLVTVGERGDPVVSRVRFELGKPTASDCRTSTMPPGWRADQDGGALTLEGPVVDPPVFLRLEPGIGASVPQRVVVHVYSNRDRVFKEKVPLTVRQRTVVGDDALGQVLVLPPSMTQGETVTATVIDGGQAPTAGQWSLAGEPGRITGPPDPSSGEYQVEFEVIDTAGAGNDLPLVYVDPWGETAVEADAGSVVNVVPSSAETGPPRIEDAKRYVFIGHTGCVCGHFPTPESRSALGIGGLPIEQPLASSSSVIVFRLPEEIDPGTHAVTVAPSVGFEQPIDTEIVALRLSGSIDQELLMRGQSTPMQIVVEGADEALELRLTNETPEIISLEGGEEGIVMTSGGDPNTVERVVHGHRRGDFNITYEMADDPCPCGPEGVDTGTTPGEGSPVRAGYPLPTDVDVGAPTSTGRTTGHIADVTVRNTGDAPIAFPDRALYIPSTGGHQGYVVPRGGGTSVPPGATRTVPLEGYCTDVDKPPVPEGESLPEPSEWTVPTDPTGPFPAPGDPGFEDQETGVRIIGGTEAIVSATERLQEGGELTTPYSSNPERERETVNQQTIWRYTSEIEGRPYTKEDFGERLEEQYEERTETPIESAPEEDRERLEEGIDHFWEAFDLVGVEAKVFRDDEETPPTAPESVPLTTEEPPCDIDRSMEHSDADSEFQMSESYKDEEKRANLSEWFKDLPEVSDEPEGGTFEASRFPASSWAVAGRDFIGGYTNAVAKHVYAEAGGGTDWVWSTELIEVDADSNGVHTMTVTPPPGQECETLVVGAGGGVVEAWSNTVDPIADTRGIVEALRVVRDVTVIVVSVALAPATAGASVAVGIGTMVATKAFDGEFSSNANAAVAVEGRMRVQAGRRKVQLDANSRSTLSNDGDIESDAAKVAAGETSDAHATTLAVSTDGLSALKSRAESNGVAEGTVESQVGVAMVAFCRCGGGVQVEYLTDSGLFLVEEGAAGAATRTAKRLEEMLGDAIDPYMELPPEQVIPKARADLPTDLEAMLRDWYLENGSDSGGFGYFEITREGVGGN